MSDEPMLVLIEVGCEAEGLTDPVVTKDDLQALIDAPWMLVEVNHTGEPFGTNPPAELEALLRLMQEGQQQPCPGELKKKLEEMKERRDKA